MTGYRNQLYCSPSCQQQANPQRAEPIRLPERFERVLSADPCSYCGVRVTANTHRGRTKIRIRQALDHIDPLSHGGTSDETNFTAACKSCNSSKRNDTLLFFLLRRTQ